MYIATLHRRRREKVSDEEDAMLLTHTQYYAVDVRVLCARTSMNNSLDTLTQHYFPLSADTSGLTPLGLYGRRYPQKSSQTDRSDNRQMLLQMEASSVLISFQS